MHSPSFHGRVLRKSEWSDFRLTEVAYPPRLKTRQHSHKYGYIGIVMEGGSTQVCSNRVRRCCPRSVIFHPAGESHSDIYHDRPSLEINVEINPAKLEDLLRAGITCGQLLASGANRIAQVATVLRRESWRSGQLSASTLENLLAELLANVLAQGGSELELEVPTWLRKAKSLIISRFREHLKLTAIAQAVGHHPVHLARQFHRHYARTIGEEIRRLRVEFACQRILEGGPLADVALDAGFCDQSHLTRVFRNVLGLSPLQFRNDAHSLSTLEHAKNVQDGPGKTSL